MWYIAERDLEAALRFEDRLTQVTQLLAEQPFIGRTGELAGTREFFPWPTYRLIYQVEDERTLVLALVHTAQRWPPVD